MCYIFWHDTIANYIIYDKVFYMKHTQEQTIELLNAGFEDELGEDLIKYYLFYVEEIAKLLARNSERNELIASLEHGKILKDNETKSEVSEILQDSVKKQQAIASLREESIADREQYEMIKQLLEGIAKEVDSRMM